jgi:hypothetical protein
VGEPGSNKTVIFGDTVYTVCVPLWQVAHNVTCTASQNICTSHVGKREWDCENVRQPRYVLVIHAFCVRPDSCYVTVVILVLELVVAVLAIARPVWTGVTTTDDCYS